ncbi:MAG: flavodoxin-dependent (E)-4-hydroxy-3-methylbut-2-enyl-diphosphate synthase [Kiritimatiellae bacterium]|nr:flavodoxin-dependent (E)-4-hydroxy-3-methylbut-2-enyl-diphosphate synthase [Kiritimatiellia bacterium]
MRCRTREVTVGKVPMGGGAPVSVQTMSNVDPHDAAGISAQIESCAALGCDLYRLTVPDLEAAKVLGEVKKTSPLPLIADIHFDYRCALAAIEAGTDALRLNPGNIGSRDRVQAVVRAAKAKKVPIRIGVNFGSLERDLDVAARSGRITVPEALCRSALGHLKILEDEGFRDVVISAKASNVKTTLESYRLLAERTDCPLHIGVTEAGTFLPGAVRNSVALGILLSEGIGDTVRVSLTDRPEQEVRVGMEILRSLGLKPDGPAITSCPTCGRTKVNLFRVASEVEERMEALAAERRKAGDATELPHVAVMGCVVNGPGEAKGADIALCGGLGEFILFVKGENKGKVSEKDAPGKVMEHVVSLR